MANIPRIAFIATYTEDVLPGSAHRILLIGTTDQDGMEWRYVTWELEAFLNNIKALGETDLFDPFTDTNSTIRFHAGGTNDQLLLPLPATEDDVAAAVSSTIEIRHVSVVAAYCAGSGLVRKDQWLALDQDRLLRLDVAAYARDGNDEPLDPQTWRVSRVRLTRKTGATTARGELESFDLTASVRMPFGAHAGTRNSTNGDRFDTRLILHLFAERGAGRSLWMTSGTPKSPIASRGALCDQISMTATTAPWNGDAESARDTIEGDGPLDLIAFARQRKKQGKQRRNVDYVPLLALLRVQFPTTGRWITPSWGLRVAASQGGGRATRLIVRSEFQIDVFGDEVRGLFPRGLGPIGDSGVSFSEEQRVSDVALPLKPQERVHWVIALRIDGPSNSDTLTGSVARLYSGVTKQVHDALRQARDGSPLSMLPTLSDPSSPLKPSVGAMPWHLVGLAYDLEPHVRRIVASSVSPQQAALRAFQARFLSYEPEFINNLWACEEASFPSPDPSDPQNPLLASQLPARFGGVVDTERKRPEASALVFAPITRGGNEANRSPVTGHPAFQPAVAELEFPAKEFDLAVRFGIRFSAFGGSRSLGLGAFQLELSDTTGFDQAVAEETTGLIVLKDLTRPKEPELAPYPDAADARLAWGVQAKLILPISDLTPFSQDDVPQGARDTSVPIAVENRRDESEPLLLNLKPRATTTDGKPDFVLVASEVAARGDDQSVTLSVHATSQRKPAQNGNFAGGMVLVLDPAPFRVAAVEFAAPETSATTESDQIAVWNPQGENGLSWRVRDDGQSVRMVLPPQVLGEAMEKNPTATAEDPRDIVPDGAAAMRFGASTYLEVDPTFADTGFREPGWNLRRVLGYPGQRSPGSRLKDLRLELLYGLTARANPPPEIQAWVTEVAQILGRPPVAIDDIGSDSRLRRYLMTVRGVLAAERRRLAVDRVWSERPDQSLRLEKGVSFQLRTREAAAGSDDAVDADRGPYTALRWPVAGAIPTAEEATPILDAEAHRRLDRTFRVDNDDRNTFPGGAAWAFESANVLMSVYANPLSDGGRLTDLHISALGGYGVQRALFDAKKSVIETETTQGRTQRYKLERMGRIAALWNRAKHVIIYERTVTPSAQFFNRLPIGLGQDEHRGRPILRKIEEYVELLEPVRRYPEDGTSVAANGCLLGVEFKSRKIRVDSRWGEDVRREGWRVPLWSRNFAAPPAATANLNPDDPSLVYPKPQVQFLLAAEGNSEHACEVNEPEKLYFYTSVVKGETGDDTDTWRPVRDVDFVDLPLPRNGTAVLRSDRVTDAMLPAEPEHVPGYERFTIGLVPSGGTTKLTHGILPDGPAASLKNLTIARTVQGTPSRSGELGNLLADGTADLRLAIDCAVGGILGALEDLDPVKDAQGVQAVATARLLDAFRHGGFVEEIAARTNSIGQSLQGRSIGDLASPCSAIEREARAVVDGQIARLHEAGTKALRAFAEDCLKTVAALAQTALDPLQNTQSDWMELAAKLIELRDRIYDIFDEVRGDLDVLKASLNPDLAALQSIAGFGAHRFDETAIDTAMSAAAVAVEAVIAGPGDENRRLALIALRDARTELAGILEGLADGTPSSSARRIVSAADLSIAAAIASVADPSATDLPLKLSTLVGVKDAMRSRVDVLKDGSAAMATTMAALSALIERSFVAAGELIDELQAIVETTVIDEDTGDTVLDLIEKAIDAIMGLPYDPLDPDDPDTTIARALKDIVAITRLIKDAAGATINEAVEALTKALDGLAATARQNTDGLIKDLTGACDALEGFARPLLGQLEQLGARLKEVLDLEALQEKLETALADAVTGADATLADIKRKVAAAAEDVTREAENRARQFAGAVQESIQDGIGIDPVLLADQAQRAFQQGGETLQLLRAVGDPPKTDTLGLNRPAVAYVASQVDKVISITPAIALVNRVADTTAAVNQAGAAVGDLLQSFGVRLPTIALTDQFIPDKLKNLSIPDMLPDIAGIDLRGLLKDAQFPDIPESNAMKITRGFDEKTLQGWLLAEIDVPLTKPTALLSFGPVEIIIDDARFTSNARLEMTATGLAKTMKGSISGDWRVVAGGQDILVFRRTGLHFDDTGHIDFKIDPERVELAAALEFVTNFLAAAGKGDGLVVEPLTRGSLPVGIAASLSTRLPDLQLGAFGISGLSLDILFGVAAVPEFELLCDLSLASKTAPFTLNVWILNGGGYVTQRLSFRPAARPSPLLAYTLDIGIVAGVGLGFNFGVVSGGVWLQVGCSVALTWTTGNGGNTTAVSVFILARGNVDVCGLVTASINLLLDVTYDGARMIGSGSLRLRFKISMFYTLNVTQRVEYIFAGQKSSKQDGNYSDAYV
ncbi:hypothetical protein [Rhizobium leguminosarum]|uniref:hypothetical protein n=1 Tax=Rhizobium leguminosarum TaxID=384 RepID=UPI003F9C441A